MLMKAIQKAIITDTIGNRFIFTLYSLQFLFESYSPQFNGVSLVCFSLFHCRKSNFLFTFTRLLSFSSSPALLEVLTHATPTDTRRNFVIIQNPQKMQWSFLFSFHFLYSLNVDACLLVLCITMHSVFIESLTLGLSLMHGYICANWIENSRASYHHSWECKAELYGSMSHQTITGRLNIADLFDREHIDSLTRAHTLDLIIILHLVIFITSFWNPYWAQTPTWSINKPAETDHWYLRNARLIKLASFVKSVKLYVCKCYVYHKTTTSQYRNYIPHFSFSSHVFVILLNVLRSILSYTTKSALAVALWMFFLSFFLFAVFAPKLKLKQT